MLSLLVEPTEEPILYRPVTRLDRTQKQILRGEIQAMLDQLDRFVQQIGLPPAQERLEQQLRAELSVSWMNIEECRPKRMAGYGRLEPRSAQVIETAVDQFAAACLRLSNLVDQFEQAAEPLNEEDEPDETDPTEHHG